MGAGAAARTEQREHRERTGCSVEAQLAESVAGQISWRILSSGGVAHHNKGLVGRQAGDCTQALINQPTPSSSPLLSPI